jgi:hypothetical protein
MHDPIKNGNNGPVGNNAAPTIPNEAPIVRDDTVDQTSASPINFALAGTIPNRLIIPPNPSIRSSGGADDMILFCNFEAVFTADETST